jgi:ketosteroid isomerase-like protein
MQGKSDLTDEVWSQEVAYWDYLTAADLDAFLSLWHEDFIGWPNNQPVPINKTGLRKMMDAAFKTIRLESASYDLKPYSVRVIGEISIVYYEAHASAETKDGQEIATHERYTHIWMRTTKGWKIIGGMSASLG